MTTRPRLSDAERAARREQRRQAADELLDRQILAVAQAAAEAAPPLTPDQADAIRRAFARPQVRRSA